MRKEQSLRARWALDARFRQLGSPSKWAPPRAGWVRAIRDALGMPAAALARRLGVSEPAVFSLERTERQGTARLDTLRRAAEALDCTLVYALVPNKDLEQLVRDQAEQIVDDELRHVRQTMALENQEAPMASEAREELIDRVANTPRRLWSSKS